MNTKLAFLPLLAILGSLSQVSAQYEATWDSLDSRPIPDWFDKAKVGIFLHWGIYSVPSFGNEWFWHEWVTDQNTIYTNFMAKNYPPNFTYQDFASEFTAEFFNPSQWVDLFAKSGAKYVILTSKHHEGYTLWPSKYSYSWNSMDVGPHRDLVGDLADALKETTLHFGLYHSLLEWYHPLYMEDRSNSFNTSVFVDTKVIPEMMELINTYQPEILWSDGNWESSDEYWKATEFIAWLYNESPVKDTIVTNDRWGSATQCNHGGILTCYDRYNPGVLLERKWENAMTIDRNSWGYRRNANFTEILSIEELLGTLVQTVSCGGNILINVGPTKEGTIVPIFQERLLQLGEWLNINGNGVYETVPWTSQNDTLTTGVWYTAKDSSVFALVLNWPDDNLLLLGAVLPLFESDEPEVTLLGSTEQLSYEVIIRDSFDIVSITFPDRSTVLSQWAWVVQITPSAYRLK